MSQKYHVKPDGTIGICKAEKGGCPYQSAPHFDSEQEAQSYIEERSEKKYGLLGSVGEKGVLEHEREDAPDEDEYPYDVFRNPPIFSKDEFIEDYEDYEDLGEHELRQELARIKLEEVAGVFVSDGRVFSERELESIEERGRLPISNYWAEAAALFDGGWRAEDKEEMMEEYDLTEEDVDKLIDYFDEFEDL